MEEEKTNKLKVVISLTISFVAIAISGASLYFSYWVFQNNQNEALNLTVEHPSTRIPFAILRENKSPNQYPLDVHIDCILTNVGNRPLSITSYNIYKIIKARSGTLEDGTKTYGIPGLRYYADYVNGFYHSTDEKVFLPVNLDVGESVKLVLRLNIEIDPDIYELFKQNFSIESSISNDQIIQFLIEKKTDIYGNNTKLGISDDSLTVSKLKEIAETGKPPYSYSQKNIIHEISEFRIEFSTSRGEKISTDFKPVFY